MGLSAGTKIGVYEVLEPIGAGGMGEVFRARDTKLNRDVALKVLPDSFADDPDRLARFQREAEVLASLNHPNIAAIYGLEQAGDTRALVLELVEGPTLADWIAGRHGIVDSPELIHEAIAIARQMADALEAAHEAGIIHRDLKPANVKVKDDGTVKVLDFGLAKALGGDDREGDPSESPTLTTAATRAGVIMGTAAYMSPEQAKGKPVDKRADIWGFGAVVYEMLTGKRPFAGEDISETLACVLTKEPDWSALPADISPSLRTYLMRCLTKDPKQRVRDVGDVRLAMEGAFETAGETGSETSAPVAASRLPWAAAVLAASLVTGLVVWGLTRPEPPEVTRFSYELPAGSTLRATGRSVLAVSPDGRRFALNSSDGLTVREMDQLDPRALPGTEDPLMHVVFSPDGRSVAYFQANQLKRLSLGGGAPVVICAASNPTSAHWAPDDTIFLAVHEGIMRVSANGGTPELVVPAAEGERLDAPQLLPDGKTLLFSAVRGSLASVWDEAHVVVASLGSGERTVLLEGGSDARYVPSGHLIYALGDGLFAVPFDFDNLRVTSGPVSMIEGVVRAGFASSANYAVSEDGTLFFLDDAATSHRLSWVDRSGTVDEIETLRENDYAYPRLSPEGDRVLVIAQGDARVYDLASGRETRLTNDGATTYVGWTPSGEDVTYTSATASGIEVSTRPADGSGDARQLTTLGERVDFETWAPDGRMFAAHEHRGGGISVLMFALDGDEAEPSTWLDEYASSGVVFSPDGRYVAYSSWETGAREIYIRPLAGTGGQITVSVEGGVEPAWAASGELFYRRTSDYRMMAVEVSTDPELTVGLPVELFPGGGRSAGAGAATARYDVTPDGQRFLMSAGYAPSNEVGPRPKVIIAQNWVEELKARVPN